MKIFLPFLKQSLEDNQVINEKVEIPFILDTSVYSEERWEQNFPALASKEGLFQYIERIQSGAVTERVKVACMLKAIYCFIESDQINSYKEFAQMFVLSVPEYTEELITRLKSAFDMVLNGSSVKN